MAFFEKTLLENSIYMGIALAEARRYEGATAPNPPVGAVITKNGKILGIGAHTKAGTNHAEINALAAATAAHGSQALEEATIYVTLEPCNHRGRTGPCTEALIAAGIQHVVIGTTDPNQKVRGGGIKALLDAGIEVSRGILEDECQTLIAAFEKHSRTGLPYIVHKLAWRLDEHGHPTMVPLSGDKTFTDASSLLKAHQWRRSSDAIITGMGTVLADDPQFTVRLIEDHPQKQRILAVIGDEERKEFQSQSLVPWNVWRKRQEKLGFMVEVYADLNEAILDLGKQGVLQALLEAGPKLSLLAEKAKVWDKRLTIVSRPGQTDQVFEERRRSND